MTNFLFTKGKKCAILNNGGLDGTCFLAGAAFFIVEKQNIKEYKNIEKPLDFFGRVCYNKNEPVIFLTKTN